MNCGRCCYFGGSEILQQLPVAIVLFAQLYYPFSKFQLKKKSVLTMEIKWEYINKQKQEL